MKEFGRSQFVSIIIVFLLGLTVNSQLLAQSSEWAVKMFSEMGGSRLHDFGSVALHANVEHRFQFKNVYDSDVTISSVSSNCGCTKASASKSVIRPGEIGEIIARVDTSGREHTKARKATIRVLFSKPAVAEVQLQVKTYIRPDVGFEPGQIDLGTVPYGETSVKKAFLQYEGREDWALIGIQKNNPGIKAEAREVRRRGGSVLYEIQVELKSDATPGYINDLLKFQTNDRDMATSSIFLPIEGLVVEPLSVKPSCLQLGVVPQGSRIAKNVVVSGSEPFKVVGASADDKRFKFIKTDLIRSVHVVPVIFEAGDTPGSFVSSIKIKTSRSDEEGVEDVQETTIEALGVVLEDGNSNVGIPQATSMEDGKKTNETVDLNVDTTNDQSRASSSSHKVAKSQKKTLAPSESDESIDEKNENQWIAVVKKDSSPAVDEETWRSRRNWRKLSASDDVPSATRVASFLDVKRF